MDRTVATDRSAWGRVAALSAPAILNVAAIPTVPTITTATAGPGTSLMPNATVPPAPYVDGLPELHSIDPSSPALVAVGPAQQGPSFAPYWVALQKKPELMPRPQPAPAFANPPLYESRPQFAELGEEERARLESAYPDPGIYGL